MNSLACANNHYISTCSWMWRNESYCSVIVLTFKSQATDYVQLCSMFFEKNVMLMKYLRLFNLYFFSTRNIYIWNISKWVRIEEKYSAGSIHSLWYYTLTNYLNGRHEIMWILLVWQCFPPNPSVQLQEEAISLIQVPG